MAGWREPGGKGSCGDVRRAQLQLQPGVQGPQAGGNRHRGSVLVTPALPQPVPPPLPPFHPHPQAFMYSKPEYANLRSTFATIYKEGGLPRFWKGLAPRMLRIVCECRGVWGGAGAGGGVGRGGGWRARAGLGRGGVRSRTTRCEWRWLEAEGRAGTAGWPVGLGTPGGWPAGS